MRILCAADHCSDKYLRHDDELFAGERQFLDSLPEQDLRESIRVCLSIATRQPLLQAAGELAR